ncbi:MAG TPA: tetratricopeptide repeat protein [Blastocatellia bacterium]|nr:tetratricopeptide repeat protein [Blastocatellia bacterium]
MKRPEFNVSLADRRRREERERRRSQFRIAALLVALLLVIAAALVFTLRPPRRAGDGSLASAAAAWDDGDYALAAERYEEYLGRSPEGEASLQARFQLANIYHLNLQRHDRACPHYEEFLRQAPAHAEAATARERLAQSLAELGRSYEAIAEYEKLNPQDANERRRIRLQIADLYFDQKNYSQALTEYAKVTEGAQYDDLSERAHLREASIYHISRGEYKPALPIYQKLASQTANPDVRRRALYGISDCLAGLSEFDQAIATLREIEDAGEQEYIARKTAELERQKREAEQARNAVQQR